MTKIDYNKLEKREAHKDGASLVKNSGRGYEKGDAKLGPFLIDYKFNAKSFTLNIANWRKHRADAMREQNRTPAIIVKFEDDTKVAIISFDWFKELLDGRGYGYE